MKKIVSLIAIAILTNSCASKPTKFSLLGEWQCIEEHGSNGAREFTARIKDGDVLVFSEDNNVTDKKGNKGKYDLHGDSLHIAIPNNERFYFLYKFEDDFEKISLSPVTSEYQIICDEGCAFVYEKTK